MRTTSRTLVVLSCGLLFSLGDAIRANRLLTSRAADSTTSSSREGGQPAGIRNQQSTINNQQSPKKPISVLFVGNSYTYFNNLPEVFQDVVSTQRPVEVGMLTKGGQTLKGHLEGKELDPILHSRHWDYVILQEQSSLSNDYITDGVSRVTDYHPFESSVDKIVSKIKAIGAKPVLYMTWRRKLAPERDQAYLDFAYSTVGRRDGCLVAPVGRAWSRFHRLSGGETYYTDGSHPSELGTYIAAATLGKVIAGIDLQRIPAKLSYLPIALSEERSKEPKSFEVDESTKLAVARSVNLAIAGQGARLPGPIAEPRQRPGQHVSIKELAGSYLGSTSIVSQPPIYMSLSLDDQGHGIATVRFNRENEVSKDVVVYSQAGLISFDMPGAFSPKVTFVGTYHSGSLSGILFRKSASGQSEGYAHWSVTKA